MAAVDEYMATGYMEHPLPPGLPPGAEGLKQLIVAYRSAFPDLEISLGDIFAEDDRVAFRWSTRGTHLSPTEEELRSLSEGGDIPLVEGDPSSPIWDVLTRNLTWRFRVAEARERERIEQELRVARQIQQELLP